MKRIIIILLSLLVLMAGCVPVMRQTIPATAAVDKEVKIGIKVQRNEKSLEDVVLELNAVYGKPTIEISAFRSETGRIIVMKKLYYGVDDKVFVVVSIVNDRVLLIDTVHSR